MQALAALLLIVSAGDLDRIDTPIAVPCTLTDLGLTPALVGKVHLLAIERGPKEPVPVPAQWDGGGDPAAQKGHLVWILPGKLAKGTTRTFELAVTRGPAPRGELRMEVKDGQYAQVTHSGKPVLRYNHGLVRRSPEKPDKMDRACYFHPVWAPTGEMVTGDFPADHLHHRGLWFCWVKAQAGALNANFWEFWQGRGTISNKALATTEGPAFAQLVARNECASKGTLVIHETVSCRAYARPTDAWVFDVTVRHEAADGDVVLGKIRYGGLGFRGRDEWNGKQAPIDVLTSEGQKGRAGNYKNARWFDFTGRLPNARWGGLLVIEHPSNPRYPNRLRIHPSMPFVSSTLVQTAPYTLKKGEPLVLRYRLVAHNGKPDKALAERLAADFQSPPTVVLRRGK